MDVVQLKSPLLERWVEDQLRYSNVWEDYLCLEGAARTMERPMRSALSIGGAGDNALSLLLFNPERLVILDLSPAQMALVELKIAAIRHLTFNEFLNLFGYLQTEPGRAELLERLQPHLSEGARDFWHVRRNLLNDGIAESGRLDGYFKKFRDLVLGQVWKAETFAAMVHAPNLEDQVRHWQSGDLKLLKLAVGEFFSKSSLSKEGRHASQFQYVNQEDIGPIFLRKFSRLIETKLISENPYMYRFLTGHVFLGRHSPPLLRETDFAVIRSRLDAVEPVCMDVESYLSRSIEQFDFMNLSDVFEYLSDLEAERLFRLAARHMTFEGRLAYWTLLVDRRPAAGFRIHENASARLTEADRTWFYSHFFVASRDF
jgi:S-adenosylmethionine-diacylglycerol 3-amino-3-carboxypropyl transferase